MENLQGQPDLKSAGAESPPGENSKQVNKLSDSTRTEAFTDGVFAITITLLVIEIPRPEAEPGQLLGALLGQWPSYMAFAISFIYVAALWMNHHALFARIRAVDRGLQWVNFMILLTTALLPFPTAVLIDALAAGNPGDERVAVGLYSLIAGLMSAAWIPVFPYLQRHPQLLKDAGDTTYFKAQWSRPWTGVILYASAGLLGLLAPFVSLFLFAVMVVYHALTSEGLGRSSPKSRYQVRRPV